MTRSVIQPAQQQSLLIKPIIVQAEFFQALAQEAMAAE